MTPIIKIEDLNWNHIYQKSVWINRGKLGNNWCLPTEFAYTQPSNKQYSLEEAKTLLLASIKAIPKKYRNKCWSGWDIKSVFTTFPKYSAFKKLNVDFQDFEAALMKIVREGLANLWVSMDGMSCLLFIKDKFFANEVERTVMS